MIAALLLATLTVNQPEMVGRGTVSTKYETLSATVAPDGLAVFTRSCPGTLTTKTVLCSVNFNDRKAKPQVLPFSGLNSDLSAQFSPDGKHLFFISRRNKSRFFTAWSVDRQASGWSEPHELPVPINGSGGHTLSISQSAKGNFAIVTLGGGGSLLSIVSNGKAQAIDEVNKVGFINDACIAPDETYIVFAASGAPDELLTEGAIYNRGDLYICVKKDGIWQKARHLDPPINSRAGETSPTISADGKFLYFCSDRGFLPRPKAVTYSELQREIQTDHNCLGKIYRVPISQVLATQK